MLVAYSANESRLAEVSIVEGFHPLPDDVVWVDLVEPTPQEEMAVETAFQIDIPTREELAEIEVSSRLYQEDGAAFMTANLIRRGDNDEAESSPVTFIVKENRLITIRYHHPQAFPIYVRRVMRAQMPSVTGWGIMLGLLEQVVDRAADHLERAVQIVDEISRETFGNGRTLEGHHRGRKRKRSPNLQNLLEQIGEEGDFTSKIRESLLSISRVTTYMQALFDAIKRAKDIKENRLRLKILQRDLSSLADHANYMQTKISFLLDAVLGMISIEQNNIIKIFSVVAFVFLPPTLVASVYGMNFSNIPELHWKYGYAFALGLMVLSALLPYLYFKRKGWL